MNVASADRNLTISPGTRKLVSTFRGAASICQGILQFSEEIFFLSLPENLSYESSSRIFCSHREARVKFINKIDSEVAWTTRVLEENFSPRCLTVNLFYVLVTVLNRGVHCLTEVALSVTSIFFLIIIL